GAQLLQLIESPDVRVEAADDAERWDGNGFHLLRRRHLQMAPATERPQREPVAGAIGRRPFDLRRLRLRLLVVFPGPLETAGGPNERGAEGPVRMGRGEWGL